MGKIISNFLTLLLALAGCVVSLFLAWEHFHPQADIGCAALGGNCHATVDSAYGHLGPIPTSLIGLAMYLTLGVLCVQRLRLWQELRKQTAREREQSIAAHAGQVRTDDPSADAARAELEAETGAGTIPSPSVAVPSAVSSGQMASHLRRMDSVVWGIALLAFGISWWLQYVSIFKIHSFCPWCFSSAILVTLLLVLSSYDYLLYGRSLTGEHKLLAGVFAFVFVMGGMIAFGPLMAAVEGALIHIETGGQKPLDLQKIVLSRKDIPTKGDPNAQIYIVEFADYQCGHCKEATKSLDSFMKTYPKKMKLGFRNFPLPVHKWAKQAAIAAEAAAEQGKFWEMHDYLFEHQGEMELLSFDPETFNTWAHLLNLDVEKFKKDREDPRVVVRIEQDLENAKGPLQIGVTPTFYVITKTAMYAFSGTVELQKAMGNPNHAIWQ